MTIMTVHTWLILMVLILTLAIGGIIIASPRQNMNRLERKIDALLKHAGIDISMIADKEALALVKAGKKTEAIELYQDLTGTSPEAASAAVDKLQKPA